MAEDEAAEGVDATLVDRDDGPAGILTEEEVKARKGCEAVNEKARDRAAGKRLLWDRSLSLSSCL